MDVDKFQKKIFSIENVSFFEKYSLELFHYQRLHVPVYKKFVVLLRINAESINSINEIPFLPVQFFKSEIISDQSNTPVFYFSSSGTTGQIVSRHYVHDLEIYNESLFNGFRNCYGDPSQYCFLALLPNYLEREGSSLVYMVEKLINESNHQDSGFYIFNHKQLFEKVQILQKNKTKIFLIGVTYALLDFFEQYPIDMGNAIVMETGGMKGKRKEMVRKELHNILKSKCGVNEIHSEYGMTELLSQAYAKSDGNFECPPWMKVIVSDIYDPFSKAKNGETGLINVIDLANIHSCAFIATQDLGRRNLNGLFEVLGRMDNSELRGCNLMIG